MPALPLIVLGGADSKPSRLPPSGRDKHPLVGFKGVDIRIDGRPLISLLLEALRGSERFDPIVIAGPRKVYRAAGVDAEVVDTNAGFGGNIRAGIENLRGRFPAAPIAVITCDILPSAEEIREVVDDFHARPASALWAPLVRNPDRPEQLGEFGWKPKYRIVPDGEERPADVLPGHMAICRPDTLRLRFLYRLMQIGYRTRNRPIAYRRSSLVRQTVWGLLGADARRLIRFRLPSLTWSVLGAGLRVGGKLRAGTIGQAELEWGVERVFVRTAHRRRNPGGVRMPIVDTLAFAEDIDTVEEAASLGGASADT